MVDDEIRNDRNPIALTLQDAESAYQQYISLRGNAGDVTDVRDATVSIAMLRAYQASLGRNSIEYTRGAAALLGGLISLIAKRDRKLISRCRFELLYHLAAGTDGDPRGWQEGTTRRRDDMARAGLRSSSAAKPNQRP